MMDRLAFNAPASRAAPTRTDAEEQRLIDALVELADRTDLTMDAWFHWTRGFALDEIERVLSNVKAAPTGMIVRGTE